ncbi:MAG: sugar ABC transporter ATP-binding protein [Erysipelotrichaceae bacterium]|nr:sugar ABC transporter ATP-binding protein [Erysipelotrichaceae bacterium]
MKQERIRFKHLAVEDYNYGILSDASFTLYEGEAVIFAGLMNSGVRAMEKLFEGDAENYGGEILMEGRKIVLHDLEDTIAGGIYCVNSRSRLNEELSLLDNLFLGDAPQNLFSVLNYDFPRYKELLERYGIDPESDLAELNAFSRKKIEIIRCIGRGAKLIFLSRVSEYCFDEEEIDQLQKIIIDLKKRGITVVYSMDDMYSPLAKVMDRTIIFRKGVSSTIIEDPQKFSDYDYVIRAIFGREFIPREEYQTRLFTDNHLLIRKNGNVYIEAYGGEIIALADDGAYTGKRSSLEAMRALQENYEIFLNGQKIGIRNIKDFVRQKIALIIKEKADHLVVENLSPADNATMLTLTASRKKQLYEKGSAEYLFGHIVNKYEILKNCRDIIEAKDCYGLSYEQKYEIMLARWLMINPDVIIFFWPLGNNDSKNVERYRDQAETLARQGKIVIVMADRESYFSYGYSGIYRI